MKTIIRREEFAMFLSGIVIFSQLHFSWWWFPLLLLTPDISLLGYAVNNRVGAIL